MAYYTNPTFQLFVLYAIAKLAAIHAHNGAAYLVNRANKMMGVDEEVHAGDDIEPIAIDLANRALELGYKLLENIHE